MVFLSASGSGADATNVGCGLGSTPPGETAARMNVAPSGPHKSAHVGCNTDCRYASDVRDEAMLITSTFAVRLRALAPEAIWREQLSYKEQRGVRFPGFRLRARAFG